MALEHSLLLFEFTNFRSLPLDSPTYSSIIGTDCRGHKFLVRLDFPNYYDDNNRWLSFHLSSVEDVDHENDTTIQCTFMIRNVAGKVVCEDDSMISPLPRREGSGGMRLANFKFIKYSEVMDETNNILQNGTLKFYVDLQYKPRKNKFYVAPNPLVKNLLRLLKNGENADITFKIQGEDVMAHQLILEAGAPFLAGFCSGVDEGTAVEIEGTTPEIFRLVLRHIYGGTMSEEEEIVPHWKVVITAADRYSIDSLKMLVETVVIQNCIIDTKNVSDYLLFADAKTCPLLKEYAMSYFLARAQDILESPYSEKLQESAELMKEILIAVLHKTNDQTASMTVDTLREKLAEQGLDVDGSKEMLAARLEESEANKRRKTE